MALTQNAMIGISFPSEQFADCWVLTNPSQPKSRDATEQPSNKATQSKAKQREVAALRGTAEQQSEVQRFALLLAARSRAARSAATLGSKESNPE